MKAGDVTDTLELALTAAGLDQADVAYRPRLLSDNGSSYVAGDLADWLEEQDVDHVRGAPYHPMTQGKIERWYPKPPLCRALLCLKDREDGHTGCQRIAMDALGQA